MSLMVRQIYISIPDDNVTVLSEKSEVDAAMIVSIVSSYSTFSVDEGGSYIGLKTPGCPGSRNFD